jgi:glutamate decarboxylase
MVHLSGVVPKKQKEEAAQPQRRTSIVPGLEHISLEAPGEDEFSTSVYGSRFAAEDLPAHEMPEKEMPKEVAYRMIKDELSLDGNPMLKYVNEWNGSTAHALTL